MATRKLRLTCLAAAALAVPWLVPCNKSMGSPFREGLAEKPPEAVLEISVDFDTSDPNSIKLEEARTRAEPVIKALASGDAAKKRAALQLIAECWTATGSRKQSKYTMIGYAIRRWVGIASYTGSPLAPKADRDAFISAVHALIDLHEKGHQERAQRALLLFLDLELQLPAGEDPKNLRTKWKNSVTYRILTEAK